MAIDDKPTAAWNEADLQELCNESRREQPRLEFKSELTIDRDSEKAEVERDVEGLANAGGGHLIYGIAETTLEDGSKVASALTPLADGGLYDSLNNLLDDRGEPKVPFDIYAISAAEGGIYLVLEVHGHRRPHRANDGRYYIRRNLRVRQMTEGEVADSYRERFERQQQAFQSSDGQAQEAGSDVEGRLRHGLSPSEDATYRQETGDSESPAWLSVWVHPMPLRPGLLDPRQVNSLDLRNLPATDTWREHPLRYFGLETSNSGFVGRLPSRDDTYPRYWVHLWPDGLLEYGELQAPDVRPDGGTPRLVATHAVAEYVHDFIAFAPAVFEHVGYDDEVVARAEMRGVAGYRLAVEPMRFFGELLVREDRVATDLWTGDVAGLDEAARALAHELSDRLFIAAGVERGAYFFDADGNYTGGR